MCPYCAVGGELDECEPGPALGALRGRGQSTSVVLATAGATTTGMSPAPAEVMSA
ncbi:hypothetical protein ACRAWC_14070 [Leifsonia sp. L25]|uniref:hypothetical protein n=1 Tax=Actinomycetes TaxID=1760 RepID=UPI003D68C381